MASSTPTSTMELPLDVLRLIFDATASLERRNYENHYTIAQMLLVSKEVRSWLEPLLYQDLLITFSNAEGLSLAVDSKTPEFLETNVKTLVIHYIDSELEPESTTATRNIIRKCGNIKRIELYDCPLPSIFFLPTRHCPTSLNLAIEDISEIASTIPKDVFELGLFRNVTHLEFSSMLKAHRDYLPAFEHYGLAPSLTHLAFDESGFALDDFVVVEEEEEDSGYYRNAITQLVGACLKLEMLVLLTDLREGDLASFATYFGALRTEKLFVLTDSWGRGGYNVSGGVWGAATKVPLGKGADRE